MAGPKTTWLVTGFPSWIARAVVREAVEADDGARIHLVVPADRADEASEFCAELRSLAGSVNLLDGDAVRLDLGLPGWEYAALAAEVDVFVNLYDVSPLPAKGEADGYGGLFAELGDPEELTVRALREALEFAEASAGRLRHLIQLGSLTVAGDLTGVWTEEDVSAGQRLRTPAERARHRAERLLWRRRDSVPFTLLRTGPVLGDSRTGEIGWYHGPHDLLEALLVAPPLEVWPERTLAGLGFHAVTSDHLGRLVRTLAASRPERSGAIHLAPPSPLPLSALLAVLDGLEPRPRPSPDLRRRIARRYGSGIPGLARTLARLDTPAACSIRRTLDLERRAGIHQPRSADFLPHLATYAAAKVAMDAKRAAEARVTDSLDG